ncbi:MAG: acetolactate decarboxylase, partial [Deltaproteobacteria bacterium]|nr:acetolactate decarboxylase [Deltaproteobacteria bacterium]
MLYSFGRKIHSLRSGPALALGWLLLVCLALVSCRGSQNKPPPHSASPAHGPFHSSKIYQSDPLPRLLAGDYHEGRTTLGELKSLGDFGLGTFDDYRGGEMLMLGGVIYSIPEPETSSVVTDLKIKTPFAMVTRIRPTQTLKLRQVEDYPALQKLLDQQLDPQKTYAISVEGVFQELKVQAVQPPIEASLPFERLSQSKAEFHGVPAKFAGFRF